MENIVKNTGKILKEAEKIQLVPAYSFKEEIKKLFTEYTDMLIQGDPSFKKNLEIQNYDEELEHIEAKYGMPEGRLYLVYYHGKPAGCIGLRKINDCDCEMKRLYVRPEYRGKHIDEYLVSEIIRDAKEAGYSHMLLDTLPFLKSAINLYKKYVFYQIESYNDSPMADSIFMKLDLLDL